MNLKQGGKAIVAKNGKWFLAESNVPYTGLGHSRGITSSYKNGVRTILTKPTPSIQEYVSNLWEMENPQRKGLENGNYYPFTTTNGSVDFGAGIDLSKQTPTFREAARRGFSEEQMNEELTKRATQDLKHVNEMLGKYTQFPDTVSSKIKMGLMDIKHQVGSLGSYKKLMNAVAHGNLEDIQEESKVSFLSGTTGKKEYDKRRHELRKEKYFNYGKLPVTNSLPKYLTPAKTERSFPLYKWGSNQKKTWGLGNIVGIR